MIKLGNLKEQPEGSYGRRGGRERDLGRVTHGLGTMGRSLGFLSKGT